VAQETVGLQFKIKGVPPPAQFESAEYPYRAAGGAAGGAKRGEVPFPPQVPGSPLHTVAAERIGDVPRLTRQQGRARVPEEEAVAVYLAAGVVLGVEGCRNFLGGKDGYTGWEKTVQTPLKYVRRQGAGGAKIHNLPEGMNAGVGSSRALDGHGGFPRHLPEGKLYYLLDCGGDRLNLPAMKSASFIFQEKSDVSSMRLFRRGIL